MQQAKSKPVIGLTSYRKRGQLSIYDTELVALPTFYTDGVNRAGGLAVILPPQPAVESIADARALLRGLDGLIVAGGADVNPRRYGQEPGPHTETPEPLRDLLDELVLRAAIEDDLPFLGICRGAQMLNVHRGGTLHQHLPDVVGHDRYRVGDGKFHPEPMSIEPDSRLAEVLGGAVVAGPVYHHQAIDQVGSGLRVTARGFDGVIEGLELEGHRYGMAVQWHPEQALDDENIRLFEGLVRAAANR